MLPAQIKKEFRGGILTFLYDIHPLSISLTSIYQTYFQYYGTEDIDRILEYLVEKNYVEEETVQPPNTMFETVNRYKISPAGIDLLDGTKLGRYVEGPGKSGEASFDMNCRCRVTAHVRGFPPAGRYIRGKGTDEPYQTYTEWMIDKAKQGVSDDKEMESAIQSFQKYMIQYHQESFVEIDTARKLDGYALNINHETGGSHARVIRRAFGLSDGDGEYLGKQIRQNLIRATIKDKRTAGHGRIYNALVPITGKNGHTEEIEVGFIVDFPDDRFNGNAARLTTVYNCIYERTEMKGNDILEEIDVVRLKCDVQGYRFSGEGNVTVPAGTEGTIIIDWGDEAEVEYFDKDDDCIHFDTSKDNLELVWKFKKEQ